MAIAAANLEPGDAPAVAAFARLGTAVCEHASQVFPSWNAGWRPLEPGHPAADRRDRLESAVASLGTYLKKEETVEALLPLAVELYGLSGLVPFGRSAAETVPPIEASKAPARHFLVHYAIPSIAWAIVHGSQSPPSAADWTNAAERALRAWRSPHVEWVTVGYLKGAGPDRGETIRIARDIELRYQHDPLCRLVHDPSPNWFGSRLFTMGAFVGTTRVSKADAPEGWVHEKRIQIQRFMMLLRLVAPGHYGIEEYSIVPSDDFFQTGPLGQLSWPGDTVAESVWPTAPGTWIDQPIADRCYGVLRQWNDGGPMTSLAVPLERFTLASSRNNDEDVLIDLVIALEGSLLAGNDKDQLKVRCSLRGAYLLGNEEEPVAMQEFFGRAYDARSKIIHGANRLADMKSKDRAGLEPDDFLEKCYDVTRRVLLRYAEAAADGTTPSAFVAAIDKAMVQRFDRRGGS